VLPTKSHARVLSLLLIKAQTCWDTFNHDRKTMLIKRPRWLQCWAQLNTESKPAHSIKRNKIKAITTQSNPWLSLSALCVPIPSNPSIIVDDEHKLSRWFLTSFPIYQLNTKSPHRIHKKNQRSSYPRLNLRRSSYPRLNLRLHPKLALPMPQLHSLRTEPPPHRRLFPDLMYPGD
jgi:hypothetical protein